MRIDKFLSACGAATRSEAKKLIKSRRITIDGVCAKSADEQVDAEKSVVALDGKELIYREFVYIMLNKPQGYISAVYDNHYPVVTELIGSEYSHFNVSPVGRLDLDTEGLLILTNDGKFNHNMTSPNKNVYKRYFAKLDKPAEKEDIAEFKKGMAFKDFTAKPALLEITANPYEVFIEIAEGKFHQVKRMCERIGKSVVYLKRVSIGTLVLDDTLTPGEYRELTSEELAKLIEGR